MPTSTRPFYALLGGTLEPHEQATSAVEAHWSDRLAAAPAWALVRDDAYRGLSLEHARSVSSAHCPAELQPAAGIVSVTDAICSEVGTVPAVIDGVMRILLTVLFEPGVAESDESLRSLALRAIRTDIFHTGE